MQTEEMRLQKYIAAAGVASRRKAEELISKGAVEVDGVIVTKPGTKVLPGSVVKLNGLTLEIRKKKIYIMLNKPEGYITSSKDQFGRKTVLDLVKGIEDRIFAVGRLDYDTSGMILLTNDGDFANRMMHPSHNIKKVYSARVLGIPDAEDVKAFRRGILIEGEITGKSELQIVETSKNEAVIRITIHEGRNRQVKKMCEYINHPVISLKRTAIGNLTLGGLPSGQWKLLTLQEMRSIDA